MYLKTMLSIKLTGRLPAFELPCHLALRCCAAKAKGRLSKKAEKQSHLHVQKEMKARAFCALECLVVTITCLGSQLARLRGLGFNRRVWDTSCCNKFLAELHQRECPTTRTDVRDLRIPWPCCCRVLFISSVCFGKTCADIQPLAEKVCSLSWKP